MTLELRKIKLIKLITDLDNELLISKLEVFLSQLSPEDQLLLRLNRSIKDKLDIDKLIEEKGYTPPSKEKLEKIIQTADIQEPIEELLEMI